MVLLIQIKKNLLRLRKNLKLIIMQVKFLMKSIDSFLDNICLN